MSKLTFVVIFLLQIGALIQAKLKEPSVKILIKGDESKPLEDLDLTADCELAVTDDITFGAKYALQKKKFGPTKLYLDAQIQEGISGSVVYDTESQETAISAEYDMEAGTVGVEFTDKFKNPVVKASASSEFKGYKLGFKPSFNVMDKVVDMVLTKKTPDGKIDSKLTFTDKFEKTKIMAKIKIDDKQSLTPTFDIPKKEVTYLYDRKLDSGASATAKLAPAASKLTLTLQEDGQKGHWKASADIDLASEKKDVGFQFQRLFKF